jgi:hypothetical protein
MKKSQWLVVALVATLFVPGSVALASPPRDPHEVEAVHLERGDEVRVTLVAGSRPSTESHVVEGDLVAIDDVAVTLEIDGETLLIPMEGISQISRHKGDPVTNGLLIGAGAGAVGGIALVTAAYSGDEPGSWFVPTVEEQVIGGAVLGSVLGAAIGVVADLLSDNSADEIVYSRVDFAAINSRPKLRLSPMVGQGGGGVKLLITF